MRSKSKWSAFFMYGISVVHKNSKLPLEFFNLEVRKMVGAERFELSTSCTRNKRASQATLRPDVSL